MLIIKGVCSYFHIYRPPETTVRAVRHTAYIELTFRKRLMPSFL